MSQVSKNRTKRWKRISFDPVSKNYIRGRVFINSNLKHEDESCTYPFAQLHDTRQQYSSNERDNEHNTATHDTNIDSNHENIRHQTTIETNYHSLDLRNIKINISQNAMNYAVQQFIPSIHIYCTPKLDNYQTAEEIIDGLFMSINQDFRRVYQNYNPPLDFDYWHIDNEGDLVGYTQHIELYIYLSEPQNCPLSIRTTNISVSRPKYLPWQCTIKLKFVPNYIYLEEVRHTLVLYFNSIFNLEDIYATQTNDWRHIRVEIQSKIEYDQLVNNGGIMINGHVIEIERMNMPLRILICSKCNEPGHYSDHCNVNYYMCRRCGGDRSIGDHNSCIVCCHRCGQKHLSTYQRCSYLIKYRRALFYQIKQQHRVLTPIFRIFIPWEYRKIYYQENYSFNKPISTNNSNSRHQQQVSFNINEHYWPALIKKPRNDVAKRSTRQSKRREQKKLVNRTTQSKNEEEAIKIQICESKPNEHLDNLPVISEPVERSEPCPTTSNDTIPVLSATLDMVQEELETKDTTSMSTNNDDDLDNQEFLDCSSEPIQSVNVENSLSNTEETIQDNLVE